jgi:hypothetical protein
MWRFTVMAPQSNDRIGLSGYPGAFETAASVSGDMSSAVKPAGRAKEFPMAYKANAKKSDKPKKDDWKDSAPPPRRPEDLPNPKPIKAKSKA